MVYNGRWVFLQGCLGTRKNRWVDRDTGLVWWKVVNFRTNRWERLYLLVSRYSTCHMHVIYMWTLSWSCPNPTSYLLQCVDSIGAMPVFNIHSDIHSSLIIPVVIISSPSSSISSLLSILGFVVEWDLIHLRPSQSQDSCSGAVWCMEPNRLGTLLAVGSEDGQVPQF